MTTTLPKPYVFVLMPFSDKFDDTYQLGIKSACEDAGYYCERVDEQIFQGSILDRIYNQISKADVIIADMSTKNANVFYEAGYAHALGKEVILITSEEHDIPFDMQHFQHIIYGGKISHLKKELERKLIWYLENPGKKIDSDVDILELYINGKKLQESAKVEADFYKDDFWAECSFNIDINNPSTRIWESKYIELCLIIPKELENEESKYSQTKLPDGQILMSIGGISEILPGGWTRVDVSFRFEELQKYETLVDKSYKLILRIFTQLGSSDTTFDLKFVGKEKPKKYGFDDDEEDLEFSNH